MGFGRPSNTESTSGAPPLLGSFPLDHDGECKQYMQEYMKCLRANKNNNGACRELSKNYLQCRMDKGLMDKDDMKNLGFADIEKTNQSSTAKADEAAAEAKQ